MEPITVVMDEGRAVILKAPEMSLMAPELLAMIALGRGNDAVLAGDVLTVGCEGRGLGLVRYRVGDFDPDVRGFRVYRVDDKS